ncbi:MAG: signal peptidase II [Anaerolineales bacterium]|nr:signal peptidase II [Anaerolineales bacterium]
MKNLLWLLGVAAFSVALDQWTKQWVRTNVAYGEQWLPDGLNWLAPYARIVHWYNSGAAFGMFQNGNLVFTILAFVVVGVILYYFPSVDESDWLLKSAMGLQLGGAIGNLIDRLLMQKVTDFISIGNFPVFNIADASISVGVALLLFDIWIKERAEKKALLSSAETVEEGS